MAVSPSTKYGPTIIPPAGWIKSARIAGIVLPIDSGTFSQTSNPKYTNYAITLPTGPRQKCLHAKGTKETSWNVTADLFTESQNLVQFLLPAVRGVFFTVELLQGNTADALTNALIESCSLSGGPNGNIKISLSGKALSEIGTSSPWAYSGVRFPIPGWASGNTLVRSWTLTHAISLQANWSNSQTPLPAYYRPAESEYTMQITTLVEMREYDTISIGIGTAAMVTGIITSRQINYSGKDAKSYEVSVTNVNISGAALTEGLIASATATPPIDWIP